MMGKIQERRVNGERQEEKGRAGKGRNGRERSRKQKTDEIKN